MREWSYRILIVCAFLCTACQSQPSSPPAKVAGTSDPTNPLNLPVPAKSPPNPLEVKPSPTAQLVATMDKNVEGVRLPDIDPLEVEGNLLITGSATVYPVSRNIQKLFVKYGYAGTIQLDSSGTGAGIKLFCKGESDIANASRLISAQETQTCIANGRTPLEFRIGLDAATVAVNGKNTFITNATKTELAAIFTAEKWSDVNPNWPKEKIKRILHSRDSGSVTLFTEKVLEGKSQVLDRALNTEFTSDIEYITNSVASNPYALTILSYNEYKQNKETLKALSIEGVEPNSTTAENGQYLLTRPLVMYSDANIIRKKPQLSAFLNFYLTHVNQAIKEVGYFSLSQAALDTSKNQLLETLERK